MHEKINKVAIIGTSEEFINLFKQYFITIYYLEIYLNKCDL